MCIRDSADIVRLRLFGGRERSLCASQLGVGFLNALGKSIHFGANGGDLMIDALEFHQTGYDGMHRTAILP